MNRNTVDTSYREAASTLAPQAVSEYLALSPWDLERRDDIKEIWRLVASNGQVVGRLMLPLATDYTDFRDRFYDALIALGKINSWDADELQEQILATRADLFFVRLDQSTADGTIPIRQAETTIDAIYRMLRFAATTTVGAGDGRKGHLPAAVNNFLEEDVRLGHTKRGSFIFTVATRVSERLHYSNGPRTVIDPDQPIANMTSKTPSPSIFSREVMETLAYNLEAAHDISHQSYHLGQRESYEYVSPGLLESLEDIAKPEGLRSVELSFQWATAIPRPDIGTEPIRFEHGAMANLSRVRKQLTPSVVYEVTRQTLTGPVKSLAREDTDEENREIGEIVILADVYDRLRNVHIILTGEDHEWAIQAYKSRMPLRISGDLVFERQRWRLVGDVEIDRSYPMQIE